MRCDDEIARRGVAADDSWALTASGKKVIFLDPDPDAIKLDDIAKQLSMICRFTGAPSQFYSVAQHSVFVGAVVKKTLDDEGVDWGVEYWDQILAALLHDAEEYILNDLSSPLKGVIKGDYEVIAENLRNVILDKFEIDRGYLNQIVKDADNIAVLVERYYLMPYHPEWPKIEPCDMEYPCPEAITSERAEYQYTETVRQAIKMRDALKAEQE
ncbi:MAG: hypothetical protein V3W44_04975 [Dehalococcoidales bacterium]